MMGEGAMGNVDWTLVLQRLEALAAIGQMPDGKPLWRAGQDHSLRWIATQLRERSGVLVADEVGLGKTRLAVALAVCVAACGGRVAILIPPGLAFQWRDEELAGFVHQLRRLRTPWLQRAPSVRFLRKYADLFAEGNVYPLAQPGSITILSHGFGVPHLGQVKKDELWAFPYLVRRAAGMSTWGAGDLDISDEQQDAADYAATHLTPSLRDALERIRGRPSASRINDDEEQARVFESLIGTVIGGMDLVIIDEAHKSRAGSDITLAQKQAAGKLRSRLTRLLDNILLRPGSGTHCARLALTATPMELDAAQWRSIFTRLGVAAPEVQSLGGVVDAFARATRGLRSGSEKEIQALGDAAQTFADRLQPLMTRRLWRDHDAVQRFVAVEGDNRQAHPHRAYIAHRIALQDLTGAERQRLALAEALSAAARGTAAAHDAKTAGMRFSQALPPMPEASGDAASDAPSKAARRKKAAAEAAPPDPRALQAAEARRLRLAYWEQSIAELDRSHLGAAAGNPWWALQWHPRVRCAIELIEELASAGEKVLVFAEFLSSLHALDRALNIRHYLRQLRDDKPIPLPQGIRVDDPDMRRWLQDEASGFAQLEPGAFEALAADFGARYEKDRAYLRKACVDALARQGIDRLLSHEQANILTTWLIQQLCVADPLWPEGEERAIDEEVVARLKSLRDPDPPPADDAGDEDENDVADERDAPDPVAWTSIVEQLKTELQQTESGDYVFRMSPYAQLLIGQTKTATRRARQAAFNHPLLHPRVLLGQSDVMSEGLNLHRACRTVVLFHLDWNPGRIEQQIGRVDRQDSLWMQRLEAALEAQRSDPQTRMPLPRIAVHTVAVAGTYDDLRTRIVEERSKLLRAQLFGEIATPEQLAALPAHAREAIERIEIDFRPAPGAGS